MRQSTAPRSAQPTIAPTARGFTLVELLVVIAIIVLIVSLLFIAIRAARSSANRSSSVSVLRQMSMGYTMYATDHKQTLLPGYIDAHTQQILGMSVTLDDGFVLPGDASASYVFRLMPYVDGRWQTFFAEADAGTIARYSQLYANNDLIEISQRPSFGLNSIFLGGDTSNGGGAITSLSPFTANGGNRIAATRMSQVKSPASMVLFAATRRCAAAGVPEQTGGWYELRAPYLQEQQWLVTNEGVVGAETIDGPAGIPAGKAGANALPTAFLDGSSNSESIDSLSSDMRRWSPFATSPIWTVP